MTTTKLANAAKPQSKIPWFLSSKKKIFLSLTVGFAIPVLSFAFVFSRQVEHMIEQQAIIDGRTTARLASRAIMEHFRGLAHYAESYAHRKTMTQALIDNNLEQIRLNLVQMKEQNVEIYRVFILDKDGRPICDVPEDPAAFSEDLVKKDWFLLAAKTKKTCFSSVYKRISEPGLRLINLTTPLKDGKNRVIGYLTLELETKNLIQWFGRIRPALFGSLLLADQKGMLLSAESSAPLQSHDLLDPITMKKALSGQWGYLKHTHPQTKKTTLVTYAPVSYLGWVIVVRQTLDLMNRYLSALNMAFLPFVAGLFLSLLVMGFIGVQGFANTQKILVRQASELASAKEYLDKIINSIADPIFVKDRQHCFTMMNEACCRFLGYPWEKLVGRSDYEFFPKDQADVFWEKDEEVFRTGKENVNEEEITDSQGNVFTISTKKALYTDKDGNAFIVGVIRDVTELNLANEKLLKKTEELAREKAEREQLEFFAYVASHDLQEPLRSIAGFGEIIHKSIGDQIPETSKIYLKKIHEASVRLSRLIEDLLKFARVIKRSDLFAEVDLSKIVADVLETLEQKIVSTGAKISVDPLPVVYADKIQMIQLFTNLLSNALKFLDPAKKTPQVHVRCRVIADKFWEITVEDNGIGFDEKFRERIFRPFERLHGRDKYEGNGMGLAICHKILSHHEGKIWASSSLGHGASFSVLLPIRRPSAPGPSEVTASHLPLV